MSLVLYTQCVIKKLASYISNERGNDERNENFSRELAKMIVTTVNSLSSYVLDLTCLAKTHSLCIYTIVVCTATFQVSKK